MTKYLAATILFLSTLAIAGELAPGQSQPIRLSMHPEDTYVIAPREGLRVEVGETLPLRFGEVIVRPQAGHAFLLKMSLLCETPDIAKYDTPENVRKAVRFASKQFVEHSVEKEVKLVEHVTAGRFGASADFTDASLVGKEIPENEHLIIRVGMQSLSDNAVVAYYLSFNDANDPEIQRAIGYMHSLIRAKPTTQPTANHAQP